MKKKEPLSLLVGGDDWVAATLDDLELFLRSFHYDEEADVIAHAVAEYEKVRKSKRERIH